MGEQEAYQAAYGLVRERQFSEALTAFDAFCEFPFGRFAPNAHYWLGGYISLSGRRSGQGQTFKSCG